MLIKIIHQNKNGQSGPFTFVFIIRVFAIFSQFSKTDFHFLVFFVTKENQVLKLDEKAKINITMLTT